MRNNKDPEQPKLNKLINFKKKKEKNQNKIKIKVKYNHVSTENILIILNLTTKDSRSLFHSIITNNYLAFLFSTSEHPILFL